MLQKGLLGGDNKEIVAEDEDSEENEAPFEFRRMSTFGYMANTVNRTVSTTGHAMTRTLSAFADKFDPDGEMTRAMIADYKKFDKKGNEGDMPFPPGFALDGDFWRMIIMGGLSAVVMGIAALGFMNLVDEVPKATWITCDFDDDASCGDYNNGKIWWIAVVGLTGLFVGLARYYTEYPSNLPGIFQEIIECHTNPRWAPHTFILSGISLAGGAALGPEQGLGNLGGGLATYLVENNYLQLKPDDAKLFILAGMASALGALFPSPMLGAAMIYELGNPPKQYMESMTLFSVNACVAFCIYFWLTNYTYTEHLSKHSAAVGVTWSADGGFKTEQAVTGLVIGVVSSGVCFVAIVLMGLCKQIFQRLRERFELQPFLREVLPPVLGGLVIGGVNYALPATVGNGHLVMSWCIKLGGGLGGGDQELVSVQLLFWTALARLFLLAVSMNCGFIGGIIFPMLSVGVLCGTIASRLFPEIPLGLCVSTFMVSVAAGIVPMPITLTVLSALLFNLGSYETVPVFVAVYTSYLLLCGTGLFQLLQARGVEGERLRREERENNRAITARPFADREHSEGGISTKGFTAAGSTNNSTSPTTSSTKARDNNDGTGTGDEKIKYGGGGGILKRAPVSTINADEEEAAFLIDKYKARR